MRVEGQADTGGSKWRDRFKLDCSFWKNADGVLVIVDVCGLFFLRLKHCTDKVNPDPAGKKKDYMGLQFALNGFGLAG